MKSIGRLKSWTKLSAEALWSAWRSDFESDDDAIAHAVWCANRLCKTKSRSSKRRFYSIKDEFIRRYASEGIAIKQEVRYCRVCGGIDTSRLAARCYACGGSGIYASRWLYVYFFEVAGQAYSFHSYVEPRVLGRPDTEAANDEEDLGGRFSEEEIRAMRLPWSGLLKMLGYVAAVLWEMQYNYLAGGYEPTKQTILLPPRERQRQEALKLRAEFERGVSYQRAMELRRLYGVE